MQKKKPSPADLTVECFLHAVEIQRHSDAMQQAYYRRDFTQLEREFYPMSLEIKALLEKLPRSG